MICDRDFESPNPQNFLLDVDHLQISYQQVKFWNVVRFERNPFFFNLQPQSISIGNIILVYSGFYPLTLTNIHSMFRPQHSPTFAKYQFLQFSMVLGLESRIEKSWEMIGSRSIFIFVYLNNILRQVWSVWRISSASHNSKWLYLSRYLLNIFFV